MSKICEIVLDGNSLTIDQLIAFIEDDAIVVSISDKARDRIQKARYQVEEWLEEGDRTIYGITTGVGKLKDYKVLETEQELYQKKILHSHAVGMGPFFEDAIVRLAMILRVNVFCRGHSGVRVDLVERLLQFINLKIYPQIPKIGSLGIGDLQPMAHLGLCLAGMVEGAVKIDGEIGNPYLMLKKYDVKPLEFPFKAKEALALISGSTVLLAAAIYLYHKSRKLVLISDAALSLSMEAIRGEKDAFDERIHLAKGIEGQIRAAENVRNLTNNSEYMTPEARRSLGEETPRVQDAVSFRSSPQIHGAVRDVMIYIRSVLEREANASNDNPLMFPNGDGSYDSLSGGNYHGALLSYAMDMMAIVLTDIGVLSERRSARLLDPIMSYGLPCNLVIGCVGLNTGFALIQANATALIAEMRVLASPVSIGSIPSKSNQEDHNSMGMCSVRKALQIIIYLEEVLSIEFLCATQALAILQELLKEYSLGEGTKRIYETISAHIEPVWEDRYAQELVLKMKTIIDREEILTILRTYYEF